MTIEQEQAATRFGKPRQPWRNFWTSRVSGGERYRLRKPFESSYRSESDTFPRSVQLRGEARFFVPWRAFPREKLKNSSSPIFQNSVPPSNGSPFHRALFISRGKDKDSWQLIAIIDDSVYLAGARHLEITRRPVADYTRHMNPHMLIYLHAHTHEVHTRGAHVELTARSMRSCRHLRNCWSTAFPGFDAAVTSLQASERPFPKSHLRRGFPTTKPGVP